MPLRRGREMAVTVSNRAIISPIITKENQNEEITSARMATQTNESWQMQDLRQAVRDEATLCNTRRENSRI